MEHLETMERMVQRWGADFGPLLGKVSRFTGAEYAEWKGRTEETPATPNTTRATDIFEGAASMGAPCTPTTPGGRNKLIKLTEAQIKQLLERCRDVLLSARDKLQVSRRSANVRFPRPCLL